jgi:hypothetical protein
MATFITIAVKISNPRGVSKLLPESDLLQFLHLFIATAFQLRHIFRIDYLSYILLLIFVNRRKHRSIDCFLLLPASLLASQRAKAFIILYIYYIIHYITYLIILFIIFVILYYIYYIGLRHSPCLLISTHK